MANLAHVSMEHQIWNAGFTVGYREGFKSAEEELIYNSKAKEELDKAREALQVEYFYLHKAKEEAKEELVKAKEELQVEYFYIHKAKEELVKAKEALQVEHFYIHKAKKARDNATEGLKAESQAYANRRSRIRAGIREDYETAREERNKLKHELREIQKQRHAHLQEWNQIREGEHRAYLIGQADGKAEALANLPELMMVIP